jgi:hypothetical protein
MQCRACGTRIADKAIVCFRCGAPTLDASASPATSGEGRRRALAWLVAAVVLAAGMVGAMLVFDDVRLRAGGAAVAASCAGISWRLVARRALPARRP